ncbi:membrane protein containing DUF81 [gut metagenome]|uniref:Membrane protein containing DUF81 n=1 Tax=gut metagenome TaxID=749906 RepID=J9H4N2_9ZZZZ
MDWTFFIELMILGTGTGFLAGLLGIGGGMILTPFFTLLLSQAGMPSEHVVHVAIATSMGTILFTSLSSVRAHAFRNGVMWDVVKMAAPGILIGALLGAQITGMLSTFWIGLIFAGFVYFSATKMIFGGKPKPTRSLPGPAGLFGIGSLIGMISALVGAGGGFISVPIMTYCNVKIHKAIGTSAALGFPIAAAGTVGYIISGWNMPGLPGFPYTLGFLHLPALLAVVVMSIMTAPLGAKMAHSMDTKPLKRIFAGLLYLLATYMLWKAVSSC